jgi:predicted glutamine amidotransferase
MPNLLAMSFEGELAPSFDLRCLGPGAKLPDGWGLAYYPAGEPCAQVLKEPAPAHASIRSELVRAWQHLESSLFVVHVRTATWGRNTDANTQPFVKEPPWAGFHDRARWLARRSSVRARVYEPVGATDSELVFCELLNRAYASGKSSLAEIGPSLLHAWLLELNAYGSLSLVLTDGHDLIAYADAAGQGHCTCSSSCPPTIA